MPQHPVRFALLVSLLSGAALLAGGSPPPAAAERELPWTLVVGAQETSEARPDSPGSQLADLPFSTERGYGHVGGWLGRSADAVVFGGDAEWPAVWREGVKRYVFRVPSGRYLVELGFLETDVAAAGKRVFDVLAEDRKFLPDVDIAGTSGDFVWLTLGGEVVVRDGWLDLQFEARAGSRLPRVSRIYIARAAAPTHKPSLRALAGPGCAVLRWDTPWTPGAGAFNVLRVEHAGARQRIVASGLHRTDYVDWTAIPGHTYQYSVHASSVDVAAPGSPALAAGESSEWVEVTPRAPESFGLPVYSLVLPPEELARISERRVDALQTSAVLGYLGKEYHVRVSLDTSRGRWQRKKSLKIWLDQEQNRFFYGRRRQLYLSAEVGEPTLVRELLCAAARDALGLATPRVTPVLLYVNGRFEGVYLDVEKIGTRFRKRTRLEDRSGLLTRPSRGDHFEKDWRPYGKQVGELGNLVAWTRFVQELDRVGSGEVDQWLGERLYLDRAVDRIALALIEGGETAPVSERYFLEDSRNRKWEWFTQDHRAGQWGIRDRRGTAALPDPGERAPALARGTLFGASLGLGDDSWSCLETRLWSRPPVRARILDRVESLLDGPLSPQAFDRLVGEALGRVEDASALDIARSRTFDASANASSVRERLGARYRRRVEALRAAVAVERARPPAPVVLSEVLAVPGEGQPWIELRQREGSPLAQEGWFLTDDPGHPERVPLGGTPGAGGERLVLDLPVDGELALRPSGGKLLLYRRAQASGELRLVEVFVYGRQVPGVSYGRRGDDGELAFLATPTRGAPNGADVLLPPPLASRHDVVEEKSGDLTLRLQPRLPRAGSEMKADSVHLMYRETGAAAWGEVALVWDRAQHRWSVGLEKSDERPRTEYWFRILSADGVERAWPPVAPDLTLALVPDPGLVLNEVLPRPRREQGEREFIEIHNPTEVAVDLGGMFLTDRRSRPTRWRIPEGESLPPGGYVVFWADGRDEGRHTNFSLSNSGEFLGLYGRIEEGNLPIDALAFRGISAGQSWGRTQDGTHGFRAWREPTPGERNVPRVPPEVLERLRRERAERDAGSTSPR